MSEVSALETRLDAWGATLRASESDEAFLSSWAIVAAEVAALASSAAVCELLESEEGRGFHGRLAPFQRRYLHLMERAEAEQLLGTTRGSKGTVRDLLRSAFARNAFDRLEEALRLVEFDVGSRIVVVGCGAFPAAALFFHERTRTQTITAIDIDRAAVRLADGVVRRHCSERLEIRREDGCACNYGAAGVVYVTNQVTPKAEILRRIAATASQGVRVLVRDPFGAGRLLAASVDGSLPAPWRVVATGALNVHFLSRHLLLARHDGRTLLVQATSASFRRQALVDGRLVPDSSRNWPKGGTKSVPSLLTHKPAAVVQTQPTGVKPATSLMGSSASRTMARIMLC
jgi:hypothetical protein